MLLDYSQNALQGDSFQILYSVINHKCFTL